MKIADENSLTLEFSKPKYQHLKKNGTVIQYLLLH